MDRQPRLPKGGTIGTGNVHRLIEKGAYFYQKECVTCGTRFSVPKDAYAKVTDAKTYHGEEITASWFCHTRQTRINGVSEYQTPRRMLKAEAVEHFNKLLGAAGIGAKIFRKVDLSEPDAFPLCRKCLQAEKTAEANQWRHNVPFKVKRKGVVINEPKPNLGKPLPQEFVDAKLKAEKRAAPRTKTHGHDQPEELPRIWNCTVSSTRGERGYTISTTTAVTEKKAREYFRYMLNRGNLSGCSIY